MNPSQKYTVNQYSVESLISFVKTGEIAIPEIQRPFVWSATKVRDLIDSLYQGFPVGYIVTWLSPNVRLKDGRNSVGKKILIDGQQRVTALTAALLGQKVKDADYNDIRIKIAFNPIEQKFEVSNSALEKDSRWIGDIAPYLSGELKTMRVIKQYCEKNPGVDEDELEDTLDFLKDITKKQIGVIELSGDLDIDSVTEIFIRINSQGVPLGQADFVMSKIAADTAHGGSLMRKCVDHFCHLLQKPEFFGKMKENDREFTESEFFQPIAWTEHGIPDGIYTPSYADMLRVAFTYKFSRGKLSDLVSLLSGRNFETRKFEEAIVDQTYKTLKEGLLEFVNETNFKRFVMIVKSAGFCKGGMISSKNVLNFGYALFLKLRASGVPSERLERAVRRWIVMSLLTARYNGPTESKFGEDIKEIGPDTFEAYLEDQEKARLSDAFWTEELVQDLNTTSTGSAWFNIFLASQCKTKARGFLSRDVTVENMIELKGDIHHIFPKKYLEQAGMTRKQYNQVANFAYVQTEINIAIGKKAPEDYLGYLFDKQCQGKARKFGGITAREDLERNFKENCVPLEAARMGAEEYDEFLRLRRRLMAERMREYYQGL